MSLCAIVRRCLRDPMRFSRTPTRDRQTDTQTDRRTDRRIGLQDNSIYRASIASRGKRCTSIWHTGSERKFRFTKRKLKITRDRRYYGVLTPHCCHFPFSGLVARTTVYIMYVVHYTIMYRYKFHNQIVCDTPLTSFRIVGRISRPLSQHFPYMHSLHFTRCLDMRFFGCPAPAEYCGNVGSKIMGPYLAEHHEHC